MEEIQTSSLISTLISIDPPNIIFTVLTIILVITELITKKDLKGQIISLGVLGTFVGIFIGLQDFDPTNMKNSVNEVLIGLKTAFATSILGMGSAIFLSIYQKIRDQISDDNKTETELLSDISSRLATIDSTLSFLPRLDNSALVIKLEALLKKNLGGSSGFQDGDTIQILKDIKKGQIEIRDSIDLATQELSKNASEEIIKALQKVIIDFNSKLTEQFGSNFVRLNDAVFKLVEWQNNYKTHLEEMQLKLHFATSSIEQAKESMLAIEKANREVLSLYANLSKTLEGYKNESDRLAENLDKFVAIAPKATELFTKMDSEFKAITESFRELTLTILEGNRLQGESFSKTGETVSESLGRASESLERQRYEIGVITNHFRLLGEQVPEALRVSLDELNHGLTMITAKFKRDYEDMIYTQRERINETRF